MSHFFKTELGQNALQQRNIELTARQRRLLLLIDHEDFQDLNHDYKQRIAPTELVQQLIDMGLLAQQATQPPVKNEIKEEMKFNANIKKRERNRNYLVLNKNRLDVIVESLTIKEEVKDRICSIKTSSPFYYDLTKINSNKQKISKKWRRGERVEIELPTKEELEEKIEKETEGTTKGK